MDDHADTLGLTLHPGNTRCNALFSSSGSGAVWRTALSRFWRLDEDGSYLITMNSVAHPDYPMEGLAAEVGSVMIILTVAPRKDHSEYDDDLREVQ